MILSIVVPVFNEEDTIGKLLIDLKKCPIPIEYEIIIVDDNSADCTREIVLHECVQDKKILLISRKGRHGLGRSLKEGFKAAKGDIIVTLMGDLSDDVKDLPLMLRKICCEGYDFVCASRYTEGGQAKHNNILKGFLSKFLGKIMHFLTKIPTADSTNAYKMFRKDVLKNVGIIESNYYSFGFELLLKAHKKRFKITEIPTIWQDRQKGKSHFMFLRDGFQYLSWLIFAWFRAGRR
jgi:glycosyltransferase involved in cell wall biosynthesis